MRISGHVIAYRKVLADTISSDAQVILAADCFRPTAAAGLFGDAYSIFDGCEWIIAGVQVVELANNKESAFGTIGKDGASHSGGMGAE